MNGHIGPINGTQSIKKGIAPKLITYSIKQEIIKRTCIKLNVKKKILFAEVHEVDSGEYNADSLGYVVETSKVLKKKFTVKPILKNSLIRQISILSIYVKPCNLLYLRYL